MKPIDWHGLFSPEMHPVEVLIRVTLVYFFAQLVMRLAGRKELGRYSTFDVVLLFLVTVCLRRTLVGDDNSLTTGFLALATLGAWDRFFSWLAFKSGRAARVLQGPPLELVHEGELVHENLRKSLLSCDELMSRLRGEGKEDLRSVRSAYLEPDGKVTFLFRKEEGSSLH